MSASPVANATTMSLYGGKESASEVRGTTRNQGRVNGWTGAVSSIVVTFFSRHRVGPAASLRPKPHPPLPPIRPPTQFWVQKYERDARKNWDVFYKNNGDRFFKDRHYFGREWAHVFPAAAAARRDDESNDDESDDDESDDDVDPLDRMGNVERARVDDEREVGPAPRYANPASTIHPFPGRVFLEIGCGAGNSAFPLLDLDPHATVFCCDFSPRAVALVERRRRTLPADKRDRIRPFVCDVSRERLCGSSDGDRVPPGCVDVCTMVFVLSAIAPERMPDVLRNVSSVMRPGGAGRVLLRDYADGDLSQRRLCDKGDGRKLGDNYYVRGDGTRAFYFEKRFVKDLFAAQGMALEELTVHARAVTNRASGRRMDRRWIQCSFASAATPATPLPPPPPPPELEWRRRAREAESARVERAAKEEAERAAREEEARVEGERARAAVGGCDRRALESFLEELRLAGRITADEIATRLG